MENTEAQKDPEYHKEDEIDLRKLFQAIGSFFLNIWYWFIGALIFFRSLTFKNKFLLLAAFVIGLGWSAWNTTTVTPFYQGSLLVTSPYLKSAVVQNIVDNLNGLDSVSLAATMGLPDSTASKVRRFSFSPVLDETDRIDLELLRETLIRMKLDEQFYNPINEYMTTQIQSYEIFVETYDRASVAEVSHALEKYCREFEYVKKRLEITQQNRERKKEKLKLESSKLDSLKSIITSNLQARGTDTRQGSNNVILADGDGANPLNVFTQDLRIYDQILAIDYQLFLNNDFSVLRGSSSLNTPASPSFLDNSTKGVGYALAIAYLIAFLIQINQYLNRVQAMQKAEASNENE